MKTILFALKRISMSFVVLIILTLLYGCSSEKTNNFIKHKTNLKISKPEIIYEENLLLNRNQQNTLKKKKFSLPIQGKVKLQKNRNNLTTGVYIFTNTEQKVHSVSKGIVLTVKNNKNYGNYIIIFHPKYKIKTAYSNLDSIYLKIGDEVKKNDTIGEIQKEKSLYFSIEKDNKIVNIKDYIDHKDN